MTTLGKIRLFALAVIIAVSFVVTPVQARVDYCPTYWCDMEENCFLGEGLYWQDPHDACEDWNCDCIDLDFCEMGGNENFHLCWCPACI